MEVWHCVTDDLKWLAKMWKTEWTQSKVDVLPSLASIERKRARGGRNCWAGWAGKQRPVCFTWKLYLHTLRNHSIVPPRELTPLPSPPQYWDYVSWGGSGEIRSWALKSKWHSERYVTIEDSQSNLGKDCWRGADLNASPQKRGELIGYFWKKSLVPPKPINIWLQVNKESLSHSSLPLSLSDPF